MNQQPTRFDPTPVLHLATILMVIARVITYVAALAGAIPGFIAIVGSSSGLTGKSRGPDTSEYLFTFVGAVIGFAVGYLLSLIFRVVAQLLRVQLRIEENTRKVAV